MKLNVQCHSKALARSPNSKLQDSIPTVNRRRGLDDPSVLNMNDDWKRMFGGPDLSFKQMHSSQTSPYKTSFLYFYNTRFEI